MTMASYHLQVDVVYDDTGFVHFINGSLLGLEPLPICLTLFLDLPASLSQSKRTLAKEALGLFLRSLNETDLFRLVLTDPSETQDMEAQTATIDNIESALDLVSGLNSTLACSFLLNDSFTSPQMIGKYLVISTNGAQCNIPMGQKDLIILSIDEGQDGPLLEVTIGNEDIKMIPAMDREISLADHLQRVVGQLKNILLLDGQIEYYGTKENEDVGCVRRFSKLLSSRPLIVTCAHNGTRAMWRSARLSGMSSTGRYERFWSFHPRPSDMGCHGNMTLCTETLFGGQCQTFESSQERLEAGLRHAASAHIEGTCAWTLFTKTQFKGQSVILAAGSYETIPRFPRPVSSLQVTVLSPEKEMEILRPKKSLWQKVQLQLMVQDNESPPSLSANATYLAIQQNHFLTPYSEAIFAPLLPTRTLFISKEVMTFKDLRPVFFDTDDTKLKELIKCQPPVECRHGFSYQPQLLLQGKPVECDGQLKVSTETDFGGDSLELKASIQQLYHQEVKFRIRSLATTGNCCWLIFTHHSYKGQVRKICGQSWHPAWKTKIGSIQKKNAV